MPVTDAERVVDEYLKRIAVNQPIGPPNLQQLATLQTAHLVSVPFENLDVFAGTGVTTDLEWSLPKIVQRRRGGWCFELNGAFGWLLGQLGYNVDYLSCRVSNDGTWGPALDHCALAVHLDGQHWLVDVGFGDCCMVPIALVDGEHDGTPRRVRVEIAGDEFRVSEFDLDGTWGDRLRGSLRPHGLADFTPRSTYLQSQPGLEWTQQPFATRATAADGSRVTLRHGVLRRRQGSGAFVDRLITDDEFPTLLAEHFGL